MKLATLNNESRRDGRLVVVSTDLGFALDASHVAPTLQFALENWSALGPKLGELSTSLARDGGQAAGAFAFDAKHAAAPLPRAYQWCDGSAFLNHGSLMERALGMPPIPDQDTIPLMYQGTSDDFLGPCDDVPLPDEAHGIDFEGEYGVIVGDVPMGATPEAAAACIRLVVQINDLSLRAFAAREMRTGFGFLQAKPTSSFAPVAVTPDELGAAWVNGRVALPLHIRWNGERFGEPNGIEMNFSFGQLIAHAAKTRRLRAGTIIGSGTVSNAGGAAGSACIAERRAIEIIRDGKPSTGFMHFNDTVRMEALDAAGATVFGAIEQRIVNAAAPR